MRDEGFLPEHQDKIVQVEQEHLKPAYIKEEEEQILVEAGLTYPVPLRSEEADENPHPPLLHQNPTKEEANCEAAEPEQRNQIPDFSKPEAELRVHIRPFQKPPNFPKNSDLSCKPFCCSACGRRFSQNSNLKTHMRIHTGEKPFACSYCNKRFVQKVHLKSHMVRHTQEKLLGCSACGQRFSWVYQLRNHRCANTEQNSDKAEEAETAAHEGSASAESFQSQQESSYVSAPQMLLKDISKGFTQKHHLQGDTAERGFSCSVCSRVFLWKRQLQRHMSSHAGVTGLSCSACSKTFALPHQLRLHQCVRGDPPRPDPSQTREPGLPGRRGVKLFPCFQCGKAFGLKNSLLRHLRCHVGEKTFGCGKQFRDRGNMEQHVVTHTGGNASAARPATNNSVGISSSRGRNVASSSLDSN